MGTTIFAAAPPSVSYPGKRFSSCRKPRRISEGKSSIGSPPFHKTHVFSVSSVSSNEKQQPSMSPLKALQVMQQFDPPVFRAAIRFLISSNRVADALQVFQRWKIQMSSNDKERYFVLFIKMFCELKMPIPAEILLREMDYEGFQPALRTIATIMICYIENRLFENARKLWNEILVYGTKPGIITCTKVMNAYANMGRFHDVSRMFEDIKSRDFLLDDRIYAAMISCYAKAGQLGLMEDVYKEMLSKGSRISQLRANTILQYHCYTGSLIEMQKSYRQLENFKFLLKEDTIRAMALMYLRTQKFYLLEQFITDINVESNNFGNLLWNLLLLSSAANFKMKKLQKDFLCMVESGFTPDLMTFNIRALAFSRMQMYWDLYVTILHMQKLNISPDLVTYGSVVDCYISGKMVSKLPFALSQMGMQDSVPKENTDSLVHEAFGKGDFHMFVEDSLQYLHQIPKQKVTYSKVLKRYLKKCFRKDQLFWNY